MSMAEFPLETLVINIPGERKANPEEQAQQTLDIAHDVCAELAGLRKICQHIKEVDGKPASIIGLKLTGKTSVEIVEVTYMQNDERVCKTYSPDEFCALRD